MGWLYDIIDRLGRGNLVMAGIALFTVGSLWAKHRNDSVDFVLSIVVASPFIGVMLVMPVMSWTKLFLFDAPRAAAFGGKHYLYHSQEVRLKFDKGHPWARLSDVCKILGVANPEKIVKRFSGIECDNLDTDYDWLSEYGVKRLTGMPLGPEAAKFGAWFDKTIARPAEKMRDRGTPTTT
jgi:hypothetical protein